MSKLRIFFVMSLVILAVLIVFTVFRPMATGGKYSEVSRESLLQTNQEWILQFDIVNHEGKDMRYIIDISVDGKLYRESCLINSGGLFTYIRQIRSSELTSGEVSIMIRKEGEDTPFEQKTYYLK